MTFQFGCLHDVRRLACNVRLPFLNNNNNNIDKNSEFDMADQMAEEDSEVCSEKTNKTESEVEEELLFDLEINQRSTGSVTGEESDCESFHTCDSVGSVSDLENEQTTSRTNSNDSGSEDSGFTQRKSRFARVNMRIDTSKKINCGSQNTSVELSPSQETLGKSDDDKVFSDSEHEKKAIDVPLKKEKEDLSGSNSASSSWNESGSLWDLVNPNSPIYEDEEFRFNRQDLRRSVSLKADKTPPDTPRRKKVVRFADTLGLDLESVRHILNLDSPPRIPLSATTRLRGTGSPLALPDCASASSIDLDTPCRYLCAQFPQPGAADNFLQRVKDQCVCLENAMITDMTITGTVRVSNISYHKSVKVRYTINNWVTFTDVHSNYVPNSCDGPTDRFSFSIVSPADLPIGGKLAFCVCFSTNGTLFWDSNFGQNYNVECYPRAVQPTDENAWMHFM